LVAPLPVTPAPLVRRNPWIASFAPNGHKPPVGVPSEYMERYRGEFDDGYDRLRERILARQKEFGIVASDTKLAARPAGIPPWEELSDTDQKVGARWMEMSVTSGGGCSTVAVVSWPARIKDHRGIRRQFHHHVDITPTILECAGVPAPTRVNGVDQMPMAGVSMLYTFDDAEAQHRHTTQYFELTAPVPSTTTAGGPARATARTG
jgi:arylsulfatase A-like enzyme